MTRRAKLSLIEGLVCFAWAVAFLVWPSAVTLAGGAFVGLIVLSVAYDVLPHSPPPPAVCPTCGQERKP